MANEKSKAEQYRDERKARIAASAKKNAKNMEKQNAAKKLAGKIVAIVLAAAIALGALAGILNYMGVWQRSIKGGIVGAEQKYTVAEYQFYYMSTYNYMMNQIQQYSSYGYDYGYDVTLPPDEQPKTTKDEDGKEVTWAELFHKQTINQLQSDKAFYNEAIKAGYELTEADKAMVEESIESYRKQAESTGTSADGTPQPKYSLNAYLRKLFGNGINEGFLRNLFEEQAIIQRYKEDSVKKLAASYDQKAIDAEYKKNKDTYDMVDFRVYMFQPEELKADKGESQKDFKARQEKAKANLKKEAEAFCNAISDEKSFVAKAAELKKADKNFDVDSNTKATSILKADASQGYSEAVGKWLFDSARKVNDKKVFTNDDGGCTVVLLTKGKHQVDTVDVRHMLFSTVDLESGQPLPKDKAEKAKKNAEDALAQWKKGDKTEESFGEIAADLTEDTGSQANGGLYEDVRPGYMVKEFDAWCFDAKRKTGDTGIVKTEYGYHVMYFVGNSGKYYDTTIRNAKAQNEFSEDMEKMLDGDKYEVGMGKRRTSYAEKQALKKIRVLVARSAASQQAQPQVMG